MMNTLLESKPRKTRSAGGTIFSVVLHSAIVFFAVFATARASVPDEKENRAEKVNFVSVKKEEPPPVEKKKEEPPPPKKKAAPPKAPKAVELPPAPKAEIAPPKGFKVLEAPITIPTKIPDIDLSARVTNEADFSGKGAAGGSSTGTEGSSGTKEGAGGGTAIDTNKNYAEFEVERQVTAISGTDVSYPESMRTSGAEGEVMAEFVVNENGRVESGTFKVLSSSNAAFTQAVKNALPRMRFRPAQIGKTNVSQVVQQAFVFKLRKS
ncbi:MAG: TonB family protein [Gemmatimonadales bacterium]